jgi:hypothetical protein
MTPRAQAAQGRLDPPFHGLLDRRQRLLRDARLGSPALECVEEPREEGSAGRGDPGERIGPRHRTATEPARIADRLSTSELVDLPNQALPLPSRQPTISCPPIDSILRGD